MQWIEEINLKVRGRKIGMGWKAENWLLTEAND
jgi:hypothetical protein